MIDANARNEPTASVDTPVSPCPIVQPSAVTPPKPIRIAADDVVGDVLDRRRSPPSGTSATRAPSPPSRPSCPARPRCRRSATRDCVGPQHQELEQVRDRRDEPERLHAPGVGRDEFLLERRRILGEVARRAPTRTSRRRSRRRSTMPPTIISRVVRKSRFANTNAAIAAGDDATAATASRRRTAPSAASDRRAGRRSPPAPTSKRIGSSAVTRHTREQRPSASCTRRCRGTRARPATSGCRRRRGSASCCRSPTPSVMPKPNRNPPTSMRQPRDPRRRCRSTCQVDEARPPAARRAGDRHGDREQPHPHPPPVAEVHDVGDRAHRAEADAVRDGAEDEREREGERR